MAVEWSCEMLLFWDYAQQENTIAYLSDSSAPYNIKAYV